MGFTWTGVYETTRRPDGRAHFASVTVVPEGPDERQSTITRGDTICVTSEKPDEPYVGIVEDMLRSSHDIPVLKLRWLFRSTEIAHGVPDALRRSDTLVLSDLCDENDLLTFQSKCRVIHVEDSSETLRTLMRERRRDIPTFALVARLERNEPRARALVDADLHGLRIDRIGSARAPAPPTPAVAPTSRAIASGLRWRLRKVAGAWRAHVWQVANPTPFMFFLDGASDDALPSARPAASAAEFEDFALPPIDTGGDDADAGETATTTPHYVVETREFRSPHRSSTGHKPSETPTTVTDDRRAPLRYDVLGRIAWPQGRLTINKQPDRFEKNKAVVRDVRTPVEATPPKFTEPAKRLFRGASGWGQPMSAKQLSAYMATVRLLSLLPRRGLRVGVRLPAMRSLGSAPRTRPAVLLAWSLPIAGLQANPSRLRVLETLAEATAMYRLFRSGDDARACSGLALLAVRGSASLIIAPLHLLQIASYLELITPEGALTLLDLCDGNVEHALAAAVADAENACTRIVRSASAASRFTESETASSVPAYLTSPTDFEAACKWLRNFAEFAEVPAPPSDMTVVVPCTHASELLAWSSTQQQRFAYALNRFGKSFSEIAAYLDDKSKPARQCAAFYFRNKSIRKIANDGESEEAAPRRRMFSKGGRKEAEDDASSTHRARAAAADSRPISAAEDAAPMPESNVYAVSIAPLMDGNRLAAFCRSMRLSLRQSERLYYPRSMISADAAKVRARKGTKWCVQCHKSYDRLDAVLICCAPGCAGSLCEMCFRRQVRESRAENAFPDWDRAHRMWWWYCLKCCPPVPRFSEHIIYQKYIAALIGLATLQNRTRGSPAAVREAARIEDTPSARGSVAAASQGGGAIKVGLQAFAPEPAPGGRVQHGEALIGDIEMDDDAGAEAAAAADDGVDLSETPESANDEAEAVLRRLAAFLSDAVLWERVLVALDAYATGDATRTDVLREMLDVTRVKGGVWVPVMEAELRGLFSLSAQA